MKDSLTPDKVAAILRDYRAGIPVREIAIRNATSSKTANKYARIHGLRRPKPPSDRPMVACLSCGTPCRSAYQTCRDCRLIHAGGDPGEVPLEGGSWVLDPRRRVHVWQPEFEESA